MFRDDLGTEMLTIDENLKKLALTAPEKQKEHLRAHNKYASEQGNSTAVESISKITQREARKKRLS